MKVNFFNKQNQMSMIEFLPR